MKNILVFGAGAIGRGYVPWLFDLSVYALDFVEKDTTLIINKKNRILFFIIFLLAQFSLIAFQLLAYKTL